MLTRISSVNKAFIHDDLKFYLLRGRQVHLKAGTMKNINKEQLRVSKSGRVEIEWTLVRYSPEALFCVLEHDTGHPLLSIGLNKELRLPGEPLLSKFLDCWSKFKRISHKCSS